MDSAASAAASPTSPFEFARGYGEQDFRLIREQDGPTVLQALPIEDVLVGQKIPEYGLQEITVSKELSFITFDHVCRAVPRYRPITEWFSEYEEHRGCPLVVVRADKPYAVIDGRPVKDPLWGMPTEIALKFARWVSSASFWDKGTLKGRAVVCRVSPKIGPQTYAGMVRMAVYTKPGKVPFMLSEDRDIQVPRIGFRDELTPQSPEFAAAKPEARPQ